MQNRIWRVHAVDSSSSLLHDLVRVVQAVEYDGIGRDAVPSLGSGGVLHQVYPGPALGQRIVVLTVPFGGGNMQSFAKFTKTIQFGRQIVEYDDPGMLFDDLRFLVKPSCIRVHQASAAHGHLGIVLDGLSGEYVLAVPSDDLIVGLVIADHDLVKFPLVLLGLLHGDQDPSAKGPKMVFLEPSVNLRIFGEPGIYRMASFELAFVLVEAVGDEHRNIVAPCIAGRGTEQNPCAVPGYGDEGLRPGAPADHPLLVEYEDRTRFVRILGDIVPGIDGDPDSSH